MTGGEVPKDKTDAPLPEIEGEAREEAQPVGQPRWEAALHAATNSHAPEWSHAEGGGEQPLGPGFTRPIVSINSRQVGRKMQLQSGHSCCAEGEFASRKHPEVE